MADFAQEGGHWYLPTGEPFYTVVGKNGKERAATLRDARPVGAVPSVTGIIACAAKPQLIKWMQKQLALALLTLPRIEGETADDFLLRAEIDSRAESEKAKEGGVEGHAAIEKHFRGEYPGDKHWSLVQTVRDAVADQCGEGPWKAERSFASLEHGYGGKVDLHSDHWVIDWKGKEEISDKTCIIYDEHKMQGAAYRVGLGAPTARVMIGFFHRSLPACRLVEIPEPDLQQGWEMFISLLDYWRAKTGYKP